jgi:nitric oxide reductase subunit B
MYGMGSSFGDEFTAEYLVRLAKEVQNNLALSHYGNSFDAIAADQQAGVTRAMQAQLQGIACSPRSDLAGDIAGRFVQRHERLREGIVTLLAG